MVKLFSLINQNPLIDAPFIQNFGYIKQSEIESEVVSMVYSTSKIPLHKDENRYLINLSDNDVEKYMKYTIKDIFHY